MKQILITGANRGIGLEMTRQYIERGDHVFATCRQPDSATALHELAATHPDRVRVIALDVTSDESVQAAHDAVREHTAQIDILVNNAGQLRHEADFAAMTPDTMQHLFNVNAVAVLRVSQAFLDMVKSSDTRMIVHIGSDAGSIGIRQHIKHGSYAISKAALNMLTKVMANNLAPDGIITVVLHPGWVQTDMGGSSAALTPTESATGLLHVIDGLTPAHNGHYYQWDGSELPW